MDTFTAAVTLFLIMDPLGNLPLLISALKKVPEERKTKVVIRELILSIIIMLLFLFAGESILTFLNLRQESVGIAGGIILFLIAIKMIFPVSHSEEFRQDEPFLVPIAIPMIAGPSILAALLLLTNEDPNRMLDWSIALIAAWLASALILLFSKKIQALLGDRGLVALERLMGMVLVMVAVQMLLDGIGVYFKL
ncbi:MAG: YhgN family NAAT transporter [Bacteriovoracaceae bacterium]|nr:YhgN family NAAT transporter [Bacteriovoracaceae bacterium]